MKLKKSIVFNVLLFLFILSTFTQSIPLSETNNLLSTVIMLTDNQYDDSHSRIHEGQVTWMGYDGDDWEIYLYNGSTVIQLTDNEYPDTDPQIHDGRVAWQGDDGDDLEIFLYDGYTVVQLTDNEYADLSPKIHEGQVTWYGYDGDDLEIYLYDGYTVIQLTDNPYNDFGPQIHGGQVTWRGKDGYDDEIYLYNGSTVIQLTDNPYNDAFPHIHEGQVTWRGDDGDDLEILLYDGYTVTQLTDNSYDDFGPQIHDGRVVWYGYDGDDWEIYLYNGSMVSQLTDNQYNDKFPQIHSGRVAWYGNEEVDLEIFLYDGYTVAQLTDTEYHESGLHIHGGQVTWRGYDGNDTEIFMYSQLVPDWEITNNYEEDPGPFFDSPQTLFNSFFSSPYTINSTIEVTVSDDKLVENVSLRLRGAEQEIYTTEKTSPGVYSARLVSAPIEFAEVEDWIFFANDVILNLYGYGLEPQPWAAVPYCPEIELMEIVIQDIEGQEYRTAVNEKIGTLVDAYSRGTDPSWSESAGTIISSFSPVDMLVTDDEGRRVGASYVEGIYVEELNEVDGAFYTGKDALSEMELVYLPFTEGPQNIELFGTGNGSYELTIFAGNKNRSAVQSFSGEISENMTHRYLASINSDGATNGAAESPPMMTANMYPSAVVQGNISEVTHESVKLSWSESADADFKNYTVFLSAIHGEIGESIHTAMDETATFITVTDLFQETTYYFTVRVYDDGGLYADSNTVSSTTLAAPEPSPFNLIGTARIIISASAVLLLRRKLFRR